MINANAEPRDARSRLGDAGGSVKLITNHSAVIVVLDGPLDVRCAHRLLDTVELALTITLAPLVLEFHHLADVDAFGRAALRRIRKTVSAAHRKSMLVSDERRGHELCALAGAERLMPTRRAAVAAAVLATCHEPVV